MKYFIFRVATLALTGLAAACTTHLATRVDNPTDATLSGISYRLAERRFTVDAEWILDDCVIEGDTPKITFSNKASFKDELVEGERIGIDYTGMTNRFKTGQVDVSYWKVGEGTDARQTGFIKTFNSEIKGEEAAALKAGIGAVASAAKLVLSASGAVAPAGARGSPAQLVCNPLLFAPDPDPGAITVLKKSDARLKAIAKETEVKRTRLALIRTRTIGNLSPADKVEFDKLNAEVDAFAKEKDAIDAVAALFRTSYGVKKSLVVSDFSTSDTLPPNIVKDKTADVVRLVQPDNDELKKLVRKAFACNPAARLSKTACEDAIDGATDLVAAQFVQPGPQSKALLLFSLDLPGAAALPASSPLVAGQTIPGLVYRDPVNARIWLSRPEVTGIQAAEKLVERTVSIPQLGRVIILPLRSRFAEKSGLAAEFEPDGRPSKVTYKAIEAGGPALIEGLKLGLDEAGSVVNSIRAANEARRAEEDGAELAALKDRIALLTEQQKLAELSKAPDPEAAAREAELQILRFEKERAELRKAIAAASGS